MGVWARATALGAVAGTALAVVSGAAGWGTAHRMLAALALPPLAALVVLAWTSARRLLPSSVAALVLFGLAALVTGPGLHLAAASAAFAAATLLCLQVFRGSPIAELGSLADYVTLTKPRVMSLLLLTGGAGAFVGAAGAPAPGIFAVTILGLALACGGAGALNHYLDRDIDRLMGERTARRPVASGRLDPELALEFGVALSAVSFVLLDALVNLETALLALAGNLFYVFVYTRWLKRSTPQNIVIGGDRETARQIVWYSAALVAGTLVPVGFGVFGLLYGVVAFLLGAVLLWWSVELWRETSRLRAVRLFHYSLLYLALLFVAMALDVLV